MPDLRVGPAELNVYIFPGDDWVQEISLTDKNGAPVNTLPGEVQVQIKGPYDIVTVPVPVTQGATANSLVLTALDTVTGDVGESGSRWEFRRIADDRVLLKGKWEKSRYKSVANQNEALRVTLADLVLVLGGSAGPPGTPGLPGEPGAPGSSNPLPPFNFPVPLLEWEMVYVQTGYPEVTVMDTLGRVGLPWKIEYPDEHTTRVIHPLPMAGKAILNF